jgi:hypothetical protein
VSDFVSYSDFVGANAGNADATLQAQQAKQKAPDYAAAYSAGKTGGAMPAGQSASYGDFLKGLTGPDAGAAAMLGGSNPYDSFALAGASPSLVQQAQGQFDAQQKNLGDVYAAGQRNADTAGAKKSMDASTAGGFNAGQGHLTPEQAKQAQSDSRAAGAKYRLGKEREQYEKDRAENAKRNEYVFATLNPIGGFGDFMARAAPSYTGFAKLGGHIRDPFGIGGNAHSGFGPGGSFGSPGGMGGSGDQLGGQYDPGDAGFQEWLRAQGYDPNTGNGNGY